MSFRQSESKPKIDLEIFTNQIKVTSVGTIVAEGNEHILYKFCKCVTRQLLVEYQYFGIPVPAYTEQ